MKLNNHKWKGGTPNFHINLIVNIRERCVICHDILIINMTIIKRIIEAKDWIKKYFILIILGVLLRPVSPIIGINNNKLNSMNPHNINGLFKDIPKIEVPSNIKIKVDFLNQAIYIYIYIYIFIYIYNK